MVWKVVKSAQPPVRYRPNSDRRPDIVLGRDARRRGRSTCVATLINRGLLPLPATSHLSHHSADLLC